MVRRNIRLATPGKNCESASGDAPATAPAGRESDARRPTDREMMETAPVDVPVERLFAEAAKALGHELSALERRKVLEALLDAPGVLERPHTHLRATADQPAHEVALDLTLTRTLTRTRTRILTLTRTLALTRSRSIGGGGTCTTRAWAGGGMEIIPESTRASVRSHMPSRRPTPPRCSSARAPTRSSDDLGGSPPRFSGRAAASARSSATRRRR